MGNRTRISILIYSTTQAVLFGAGVVAVLATPLQAHADILIPAVVALTAALAAPAAYMLAPRLMTPSDMGVTAAPAPLDLTAGPPYDRRARPTLRPSVYANPGASARDERETKKSG